METLKIMSNAVAMSFGLEQLAASHKNDFVILYSNCHCNVFFTRFRENNDNERRTISLPAPQTDVISASQLKSIDVHETLSIVATMASVNAFCSVLGMEQISELVDMLPAVCTVRIIVDDGALVLSFEGINSLTDTEGPADVDGIKDDINNDVGL